MYVFVYIGICIYTGNFLNKKEDYRINNVENNYIYK